MKTRLPRPKHPGAIPKKRPSLPPRGPKLEVSSEQLTGELQMVQTVSGLDQGENSMVEFPEPFSSPSCGERPSESLHPPKGDLHKGDTCSNEGQIYGSSYCTDTTAVPIAAVDERDCLPAENIDATVTSGETAVCKNGEVTINYETPSDFRQPPETDLPVAQRPPTPEGHQSLQSSLVTGHQSCKTSVAVVACKGKRGQQRGNPAEHDDVIRNDGLLQKIQKVNEGLFNLRLRKWICKMAILFVFLWGHGNRKLTIILRKSIIVLSLKGNNVLREISVIFISLSYCHNI